MENTPLLEMRHINKSFGQVNVLNDINLKINKGEVLGLIGENGAGKSTLIKIICGIYSKNSGDIIWNGEKVNIHDASSAQQLGISTIYQELSVMPHLTAVQNIFVNRELTKGKGYLANLDEKQMREIATHILREELHTEIPVDVPAMHLKLAEKQMIEIARTLYADAQLIIMDEPTASLQAKERDALFNVIRELKSKGKSVIFISHHLDELMLICDKIAVLRDGKQVAEGPISDFDIDKIITYMVGRKLDAQYVRADNKIIGDTVLSVRNLSNHEFYRNISFDLHSGEVLGIVGVEGCGKNEVLRSLFGIIKPEDGAILLHGERVHFSSVKDAMKHSIAFVPAERKTEGLFLKQSIAWNTTISAIDKITHQTLISSKEEKIYTEKYKDQLHTKLQSISQNISRLSGGNQQKVMLARWIMTDSDIFLFEEPTRGIDVNAKTEVYEAIAELVRQHKGVIVVSSEEQEVLGICDRILVMRNGEINAELNALESNEAEIKQYAYKDIDRGA